MMRASLVAGRNPMTVLMVTGGLVVGAAVGCTDTPPAGGRTNAPPQGACPTAHALQEVYVPMVDNAMLADRTMSAVHFVPGGAELNALGVRRLMRFASILKSYGGTLHYDGPEAEESLRARRVEQIKSFLVASGLEPTQFDVRTGMAAAPGMGGVEALAIRKDTRGPGDTKITAGTGGAGGAAGK